MPVDYSVPFYSNTADDTHCYQAAFKMVLEHFIPDMKLSFDELDVITAKKKGLYTWPLAGKLWLQQKGFDIINIETFDYQRFIDQGGAYLLERYGEEMGGTQIRMSDLEQERAYAKEFISKIHIENRTPSFEDIKSLLNKHYLIICNVNARKLNLKNGYSGHAVVIKGYDENGLVIHDPGLPASENRWISYEQFYVAWAYPDEGSLNVVGFSLK